METSLFNKLRLPECSWVSSPSGFDADVQGYTSYGMVRDCNHSKVKQGAAITWKAIFVDTIPLYTQQLRGSKDVVSRGFWTGLQDTFATAHAEQSVTSPV